MAVEWVRVRFSSVRFDDLECAGGSDLAETVAAAYRGAIDGGPRGEPGLEVWCQYVVDWDLTVGLDVG